MSNASSNWGAWLDEVFPGLRDQLSMASPQLWEAKDLGATTSFSRNATPALATQQSVPTPPPTSRQSSRTPAQHIQQSDTLNTVCADDNEGEGRTSEDSSTEEDDKSEEDVDIPIPPPAATNTLRMPINNPVPAVPPLYLTYKGWKSIREDSNWVAAQERQGTTRVRDPNLLLSRLPNFSSAKNA